MTAKSTKKVDNRQPLWVQVLLDRELSHAAHRVFSYLRWRQGQNGSSWPSQKIISDDLQLTERAVRNITKRLMDRGYIQIERPGLQGRGQALHYSIVEDKKGGTPVPPYPHKGGTLVPPSEVKRRNVGSKKGGTERPTNTSHRTQVSKKRVCAPSPELPSGSKKVRKFVPPSLEAIEEYIREKELSVDAQKFFDYFTVSGWVDSRGNKVKNWKQKLLTWDNHSAKKPRRDNTVDTWVPPTSEQIDKMLKESRDKYAGEVGANERKVLAS